MSEFFDAISVLFLLSTFILMGNKRIKSYIKSFRMQSALLALAAGVLGVESAVEQGRFEVLVVCLLIIILKVIYIPNLLKKTNDKVEYTVEKDFYLNIPIHIFISCGIVVFSYFSISAIEGLDKGVINIQLVNSISVVLMGLYFMIIRKKAIGQIIGFLVIENGLFMTAMFATDGMPFIVDLGIFVDMITAVLIMGVMVFRINEKFESIDLEKLKKLKG